MGMLKHFLTDAPFLTVAGDEEGADVSVQAYAGSLEQACQEIRRSYGFDEIEVQAIQARAWSDTQLLLIVDFEDCGAPVILLFEPDLDEGQKASDLLVFNAQQALSALEAKGLTFGDCVGYFGVPRNEDPYARAAQAIYAEEGSLEFDDTLVVSDSDEGAYVMAWRWVRRDEAGLGQGDGDEPQGD